MRKALLLFTVLLLGVSFVNAQTYNVTFKADMRIEVNKGNFNPATDVVTVPGAMNNWLNEPPANSEKIMTASTVENVFEKTYALAPGTYDYKFNIGTGWDGKDEPGSNSQVTVTNADLTVTRFFKGGAYTGVATDVTFNVNMTLPINMGMDPGTAVVGMAGNFNGWSTTATTLTDPDGDKIYSGTVSTTSGEILIYKFIYTQGGITWEGPSNTPSMSDVFGNDNNRIYGVVDGTNTVDRFWNNADPNIQLGDGNMSFTADMGVLETLGVFDPAVDGLQIRGGFNGWSDADPAKAVMNQNPILPNEWFLSIPFDNQEVGAAQTFKYYAILAAPGIWEDTWERPLSTGGGDRSEPFNAEANQEIPKVYYDDVYPQFVIPQGQFVQITFRVDMTDAYDPDKQAVPMEVGDRLFWRSRQPLFQRVMNWLDDDPQQYFELFDPDGDKIYEGTLAVNGPAFNGFEYIYFFVRALNSEAVYEPTALGTTVSGRVRYIPQSAPNTFQQPYTAPLDTWLNQADKSAQFEDWPAGLSVEEFGNEIPTQFAIEQNYPNPFNPSTTIRFSIPSDELVSLKIYNTLGQEVAVLLNENMRAGSYEYKFDASRLSSGVYFYTINAGSFNTTKKMLFLK